MKLGERKRAFRDACLPTTAPPLNQSRHGAVNVSGRALFVIEAGRQAKDTGREIYFHFTNLQKKIEVKCNTRLHFNARICFLTETGN